MTTVKEQTIVPIGEWYRSAYERHRLAPAVDDGTTALTYGELERLAVSVQGGLSAEGVRPGDRLVLIGRNTSDWVVVDHACYAGGLARVAISPRLHMREVFEIITDSGATVLAADGDWLSAADVDWASLGVRHLISLGTPAAGARRVQQFVRNDVEPMRPEGIDADTPAWVSYTSGTTGKPKGVVHSQRSVAAMISNCRSALGGPEEGDVTLHSGPISHFSGVLLHASLVTGASNILLGSFDVHEVVSVLRTGRVTVLPLVPTQITMLSDHLLALPDAERPDFAELRWLPFCGSPIAPDRLAEAMELMGPRLVQFYGSTEAQMPLTVMQPSDLVDDTGALDRTLARLTSAGRVHPAVELRIVGAEGSDAPEGVVGEIAARGPNVTSGYWNNPGATREVLTEDGWFHTGDLGYLDDGFLFIVDRKKDMIVTGGFNVYAREVENVISELADVAEVAVVGAPSATWGEEVTAFVAAREGATVDADVVISQCREQIAGYKVPKRVVVVDALPKSSAGKVLKRDLRDQLWLGHERQVN